MVSDVGVPLGVCLCITRMVVCVSAVACHSFSASVLDCEAFLAAAAAPPPPLLSPHNLIARMRLFWLALLGVVMHTVAYIYAPMLLQSSSLLEATVASTGPQPDSTTQPQS